MSPRGGTIPCPGGCGCRRHAKPKGADSPNWVGDQITHKAMHTRVIRVRGAARTHRCLFCAEGDRIVPALDWAQLHEANGLDIADYVPLCRRCHLRYDLAAGARTPEKLSAAAVVGWVARRQRQQ